MLRQMAEEANLSVDEMAKVACFNLIAIWLREHGEKRVVGSTEVFEYVKA